MSERYLGEIRIFGGNYAPVGWALCDGSIVQIAENEALYVLLGTTYGGDGISTFALPDLRGKLPIHMSPNYPLGSIGGSESVTLMTSQLPAHTHFVAANANASDSGAPQNQFFGLSNDGKSYTTDNPNGQMLPNSVTPVGGNQPHNNMMPYLVTNYIIATSGIFPSQT
ncbi:phage tail protein [Paenibacillus gorillae]|uniref:phage tail protein n=1 Tax=Paenibacillus gorillae TaxID=1243662 RepID=UPI0005A8BD06|nr:tail fiber protein [Paenibacillus gorillae]